MEYSIEPGRTMTVRKTNRNKIILCGLPVNGRAYPERATLSNVPYDITEITLDVAYNGRSSTEVVIGCSNETGKRSYAINGEQITPDKYSIRRVIDGDAPIIITYKTVSGTASRDVTVTITITPVHKQSAAEITYTIKK